MFKEKIAGVVGMLAALALGACAHSAILPENEPSHIGSVEVIQHDKGAPPSFAEVLRQTIMREAAYYGSDGKAFDLRIDVDKVHFKNFLVAITVGDDAHVDGRVTVTDPATGKQKPSMKLVSGAKRMELTGAPTAEAVISGMDPATVFHNRAAATMIDNLAFYALTNTFGEARAKAALAAKKKQGPPGKSR